MTEQEVKNWKEWESNSIYVTHDTVKQWLQPEVPTRKLLREYFYKVGIRPDEFILQRNSYSLAYNSRLYEIRFANSELIAYLKLSGLI